MPTLYKDLLFSPNDEGLLAYVEENYDRRQLTELIWDTQELWLLPILGTALYDELKTQSRSGTFTSANLTLIGKINPVMKFRVLADGAPIFTYKMRNKGIVTQSSDNAQPVTFAELDRLTAYFTDRYQTFADRLMKFLIENETTYPLYSDPGDGVDTIIPNGQQFRVGWFIGKSPTWRGGYDPCCNGDANTKDL